MDEWLVDLFGWFSVHVSRYSLKVNFRTWQVLSLMLWATCNSHSVHNSFHIKTNLTRFCFKNWYVWFYKFFHTKMVQADPLAAHLFWWLAKGAQLPTLKKTTRQIPLGYLCPIMAFWFLLIKSQIPNWLTGYEMVNQK